jgi:hypothetical protein
VIDLAALRTSFGAGTPEEITIGCHKVCPSVDSYERALLWLGSIINKLLESNRYRAAAHLLWGPDLFDPRPRSVARLLTAIEDNAKVIVLGGGAQGKSYTIIAWCILDWLRDPQYTGVRIISTTSAHALGNTFSSLQRFYDEAIIPLPGIAQHGFIGLNPRDRHASLSVIAIKQGESGKQSLQGFHPIRRPEPHPIFGSVSRIRLFLDEAELIPPGVWRGVGNLLSNLHGKESVKAICATNPWDVTSMVAANAEPKQGHNKVDMDRDKEWVSKMGWNTIRLDPADSENVLQRREVFPGLMTFEGYEEYRSKTGGEDAEYMCFGRGMYPTKGTIDCLIPLSFLDDFFGEFIFEPGTVVGCGGVDLAFDGDDDVIFFAGRYGRAAAFRPAGGFEIIKLIEPRHVVQLDQYKSLPKVRTEAQYNQIRNVADEFGISYDWLALDKTGVGHGVHDLFHERGYHGIMGVGWGMASTHTKILDEHRNFANELYHGVAAEMYFALRDWLEFGYIKASPNISMDKLQKELIGRKRKRAGLGPTGEPMYSLEEKKEFKSRYGFSPDRADALVMLLHVARLRGPEQAQMARKKRVAATGTYDIDALSNVSYIDFSESEH